MLHLFIYIFYWKCYNYPQITTTPDIPYRSNKLLKNVGRRIIPHWRGQLAFSTCHLQYQSSSLNFPKLLNWMTTLMKLWKNSISLMLGSGTDTEACSNPAHLSYSRVWNSTPVSVLYGRSSLYLNLCFLCRAWQPSTRQNTAVITANPRQTKTLFTKEKTRADAGFVCIWDYSVLGKKTSGCLMCIRVFVSASLSPPFPVAFPLNADTNRPF